MTHRDKSRFAAAYTTIRRNAFWTICMPATFVLTVFCTLLLRDTDTDTNSMFLQGTYETVVATGDIIEGEQIESLFGAQSNNSGDITFAATIANAPPDQNDIIGIANASGIKSVVRDGEPAPKRGTFLMDGNTNFGIDELGFITFFALVDSSVPNDRGVFRGNGSFLVQIARQRQRAPGTSDRFDLRNSESSWAFNSLGQVALRTELFSSSVRSGIFLGDELGMQPIIVENSLSSAWYSDFSNPAINDDGLVAFGATLHQSGIASERLSVGDSRAIEMLVKQGQLAPTGDGVFDSFSDPELNNIGQVAFSATLEQTPNRYGVFRADTATGQVTQIARANEVTPSGNGSFAYFDQPPLITNAGEVPFTAQLKNTSGGKDDDYGAFVGDGSHVMMVLRKGEAIESLVLQVPVVVDTTPFASKWKMAHFDGKGNDVLRKVIVQIGDIVSGSPVMSIDFSDSLLGSSGVNDLGQVVYTVTLNDGRQLLQRFTPQ